MLDGYESGMSSARESCKSTELKRCIATEMRWSKYELSRTSPDCQKKFGGQAEQESPALLNDFV